MGIKRGPYPAARKRGLKPAWKKGCKSPNPPGKPPGAVSYRTRLKTMSQDTVDRLFPNASKEMKSKLVMDAVLQALILRGMKGDVHAVKTIIENSDGLQRQKHSHDLDGSLADLIVGADKLEKGNGKSK